MTLSTPAITSPSQPKPKRAKHIRRSRSQWEALLEQLNTSGLTKAAFCKKHRITISNLYRWQHLLSEDTGDSDFIDITEPLSIVPVQPSDHDSDNEWHVELRLGAGTVLRIRRV